MTQAARAQHKVILALCALAIAFGWSPAAAESKRFDVAEMQRIVGVSDATISPDGSQIAYIVSRVDRKANDRKSELRLFSIAGDTDRLLISHPSDVASPAWAPSGDRLAYSASGLGRQGRSQIFVMETQSAKPHQLTHAGQGIEGFAWRPDGAAIAYVARDAVRHAADGSSGFEVTDNAYLSTAPAMPAHVWLVDARNAISRRLTSGGWSVASVSALSWSSDGRSLVFLRAPNGTYGLQDRSVVERLDLLSGNVSAVTTHRAYEGNALFAPDGSRIAYTYARGGDPMSESQLFVTAPAGGDGVAVASELDRDVSVAAWSPDSNSLVLKTYDGTRGVLWLAPLGGAARKINLQPVTDATIAPQGGIARNGAMAFVGSEPGRPSELYYLASSHSALRRLTDFNHSIAALQLGSVRSLGWRGPNGFREDGVLTYPPGYVAGRKYPLVVKIHGGPTAASTEVFDTLWQLIAARGYLVLAPNYRGSNSLGDAYQHAIYVDASVGPGEDIMAGVRAVEKLGMVDTSRLAVSGWSYGGQLTSWMIGHYPIWRAAVAGAAVNDLAVDYAIADDIDADRVSFRGSPYVGDNWRDYVSQSPIHYYKQIRTPTLILCNVYDVRVPIVESYEMYHALRDNGVAVKFVAYPTTGHLPNGPANTADAYQRWLDWLDRYLR